MCSPFPCFSPLSCCCPSFLSCCCPSCLPCCSLNYCFEQCFCNCLSRISTNLQFVKSAPAVIKIFEMLISGLILWLLYTYGLNHTAIIGLAFEGSLIATSACFLTTALLFVCYTTSETAFRTIRFTHFEILFNFIACLLHLGSAYFMALATKVVLMVVQANFNVYPTMTIAYILNVIVGLMHAADMYMCYIYYKTRR